jgi:radical SAM superfamily enzyme YgiQ (UPF0313 family)
MIRVLLINPEFPSCFWSFAPTCELAGTKSFVAPLGLITVAALLPIEWELRLADLNTRGVAEVDWQWADLVMISGMLVQRKSMLAIIREARKRGKLTVAGGPYPTSMPEEVLDAGVNFLVRGEAEETMPRLLAALQDGATGGVFEEHGKPVLTESPVPRYDLLQIEDYLVLPVQTSRGCPFDCEFCDVVNLYGHLPRYKSPEQVIKELEMLYHLGWRDQVVICDDNFVGNKKHARAILEELIPWMKRHGEPFVFCTQASLNLGQDKELIDLLTEANFNYIIVGVESPDEDVLTKSRKLQNVQHPIAESLRSINENGLSVFASFILGFDGERKGAGGRICELVEELGIPLAILNTLTVIPNTRLQHRLKNEARLIENENHEMRGTLNYIPTRPESEILDEYLQAVERLYEPSAYLERAYRYFLSMRPTRSALAGDKRKVKPLSDPFGRTMPSRGMAKFSAALKYFWRQGFRSGHRAQFWRQLYGMHKMNPSRMAGYIATCSMGEDLFEFRRSVRQLLSS